MTLNVPKTVFKHSYVETIYTKKGTFRTIRKISNPKKNKSEASKSGCLQSPETSKNILQGENSGLES